MGGKLTNPLDRSIYEGLTESNKFARVESFSVRPFSNLIALSHQ